MRLTLALMRLAGFLGLMAAFHICWLAGLPAVAWSRARSWQWRCLIFRNWARATAALMGVRVEVEGRPPSGPVLLVANHLSYIDVIALAAGFDAAFIAKSEVAGWPLLGILSRQMGTIFIDRRRRRDILRVNALVERYLREGRSVILFPEGTTTGGEGVLPFKSSLLEPAARLGQSVRFATLGYRTHPLDPQPSESVCWWREMEFAPHLFRMFALRGIVAEVRFGETGIVAADRKALARSLHRAIAAEFKPLGQENQPEQKEESWPRHEEVLSRVQPESA